jgi:endonuclease YncB( thermonuclease family)
MGVLGTVVGGVAAAGTVGAVVIVGVVSLASEEAPGDETRRGVVVARVIDGDTVQLEGGQRVRLIGIDTPEHGDCGSASATRALREHVEGRRVQLRNPLAVDDRDRYGRLLRYVERDGSDAGYELLEAGLGVARYDSLDGYDRHPRQPRYRSADRAIESPCERRERIREERWAAARQTARRAGVTPRKGETATHLLKRAQATLAAQRRARAALLAQRRAEAAEEQRHLKALEESEAEERSVPFSPSGSAPSSPTFTPPPGWTTDALTPGYTGCRQGYPGGRINGVYVWKPISC